MSDPGGHPTPRGVLFGLLVVALLVVAGREAWRRYRSSSAPGYVVLHLIQAGNPLPDLPPDSVTMTIAPLEETPFLREGVRRSTNVRTLPAIERPWRIEGGDVIVSDLGPGPYRVGIDVDRNRHNGPRQGGDLRGGARIEVGDPEGTTEFEVPMQWVIGVHEPLASAPTLPTAEQPHLTPDEFEKLPRVGSPARIAWDAVPGAAWYDVYANCPAGMPGRHERVTEPAWVVDLPVCTPPQPWVLGVDAHAASNDVIGTLGARKAFVVDATPRLRASRGLGPGSLTLTPTFDGRPIARFSRDDVAMEVLTITPTPARTTPQLQVENGRIRLAEFPPGAQSISLTIGRGARARGPCRALPGALVLRDGNTFFHEPLATAWRDEERTVALVRTMHLLAPVDDDSDDCSYGPPLRVTSPLTVRWQEMPEAARYRVRIRRKRQYKPDESVVTGGRWTATLPPSGSGDFYTLSVAALTAGGEEIGTLHRQFVVR